MNQSDDDPELGEILERLPHRPRWTIVIAATGFFFLCGLVAIARLRDEPGALSWFLLVGAWGFVLVGILGGLRRVLRPQQIIVGRRGVAVPRGPWSPETTTIPLNAVTCSWSPPVGFGLAFAPIALMVFGTFALVEDEPSPATRLIAGLGGVSCLVVAVEGVIALVQIAGGEARADAGLITFGSVVGFLAALVYGGLYRRWRLTAPQSQGARASSSGTTTLP
ncbi:MAG: hypothetical protein KC731_24770, partial [Myxococcales bacterium]|nr:hypothetical protein [Myxococcales bacterium]